MICSFTTMERNCNTEFAILTVDIKLTFQQTLQHLMDLRFMFRQFAGKNEEIIQTNKNTTIQVVMNCTLLTRT